VAWRLGFRAADGSDAPAEQDPIDRAQVGGLPCGKIALTVLAIRPSILNEYRVVQCRCQLPVSR
jgi:hypothetical protein